MKTGLPALLDDFRNILCVCPCCGNVVRLTEIQLSYDAKPRKSWLDDLDAAARKQDAAEDRFAEREVAMRERAKARADKQLPGLLRKIDPVFSRRGYFPQDVKALFDPVEFIIFDGMSRREKVKRVVLFDADAESTPHECVQESIRRTIKAGNCDWKTVRLDSAGRIESS